jgi:hypothetical protein
MLNKPDWKQFAAKFEVGERDVGADPELKVAVLDTGT